MSINRRIFPLKFQLIQMPEIYTLLDRIFKLKLTSPAKNSAPRFHGSKRFFLNSSCTMKYASMGHERGWVERRRDSWDSY